MEFDKTASVGVSFGDNSLPEGWAVTTLGTVVQPSTTRVEPEDRPSATYLSLEHIEAQTTAIIGRGVGSDVSSMKSVFHAGDVLYGKLRPYLNKVCRPDFDGICSTDILVFPPTPAVDSGFLLHYLNRSEVVEFANHHSNGINLPRISFDILAEMELPLPPLAEQRRIVAKVEQLLAAANTARVRLARVPTLLKRFRQAVLAAACSGRLTADWRERNPDTEPAALLLGRILAERRAEWEAEQATKKRGRAETGQQSNGLAPFLHTEGATKLAATARSGYKEPAAPDLRDAPELPEMPMEWCVASVSQIAQFLQYGTSTKADAEERQGVAMLRMGNIQDGRVDYSNLKYLSGTSDELPTFQLSPGDILFNRTNSPDLVGKAAMYDGAIPAVFASYLVRLRCNKLVSPALVCHWINSLWGKEWAAMVKTDGVSQSNINASKLSAMPFPLPPLAEQQEIVRRVEALFKFADAIEKRTAAAAARADRLTQSILARAFRGELVPTEAALARFEGRDYGPVRTGI